MPAPIGISVGDFFAVAELIHSVKKALEQSAGSVTQYAGVISTLQSFEDALNKVRRVEARDDEKRALLEVAKRLHATLQRFEKKVLEYEPALADCPPEKRWKSIGQKIKWQRSARQDVAWFQSEVQQHAIALSLMLSQIQRYF